MFFELTHILGQPDDLSMPNSKFISAYNWKWSLLFSLSNAYSIFSILLRISPDLQSLICNSEIQKALKNSRISENLWQPLWPDIYKSLSHCIHFVHKYLCVLGDCPSIIFITCTILPFSDKTNPELQNTGVPSKKYIHFNSW